MEARWRPIELNENYYTNVEETEGNRALRTSAFSGLPLNTSFDISGAYGMCGGKYSPLCNQGIIYGGWLNSTAVFHLTDLNTDTSESVRPMFLTTRSSGSAVGWNEAIPLMPSGAQTNNLYSLCSNNIYSENSNLWWSPDASELSGQLSYNYNGNMVNGFRYRNAVMYIGVTGRSSDFTIAHSAAFDTYDFERYPNIVEIDFTIYYGDHAPVSGSSRAPFTNSPKIGCAHNRTYPVYWVAVENGEAHVENRTNQYKSKYNLYCSGHIFRATGTTSSTIVGANHSASGYSTQARQGRLVGLYSFLEFHEDEEGQATSFYYCPMTREFASKVISTYGMYWTGTESVARTAVTGTTATSELLRLPIQTNGIFMGEYVTGTGIADAENADWGADDDNPFDWWADNGVTDSPDLNDYTDETPLSKPAITAIGAFNRAYAMTQQSLNDLSDYVWNKSDNVFEGLVQGLRMYDSPMDCMIDCRLYPFEITSYFGGSAQNVTLGRNKTEVVGVHLGNVNNAVIDLGTVEWRKYRGNFLDYSPFSQGVLHIPYVGEFSLDTNLYVGHTIHPQLIVDFMTGTCECVIFRDGILSESFSGKIGVDVPMSGVNASQWAWGVVSGIGNVVGGLPQIINPSASTQAINLTSGYPIGSVATNTDVVGSVNAGIQTAINLGKTLHTPLQTINSGSASSSTAQWHPQYCYLIIATAKNIEPSTYGGTVGYACEKTARLGSLSGFTVCTNPNVNGISATESERELIKSALEKGVYL